MLKRLRRKFVAIVMVLVGAVLVGVLGSAFVASYHTQQSLVDDSLSFALRDDAGLRFTMGMPPREGGAHGGLLSLLVEVSDEGVVLSVSDAPVSIDTSALASIVSRVIVDDELEGSDRDYHIAWRGVCRDDGTWRIALVDTSSSESLLRQQATKDFQIIVIALAVLLAISWWLADWALQPVERSWEQQRRFVADASHELKTPLAVILANTQILDRDPSLSPDARRWVSSTAEEGEHMKALIGDLLQLARADEALTGASAGGMRHEDVDLSVLVESAALEFDAIAFERGCLLEASVVPDLHVSGDPDWLERLARILIDNACKYGASGTEVTVSLAKEGGRACLTVHNEGNPIDESDLPHVFERFYRSDKARTRDGEGGFGLGLAIAKGIVDAHGGTIGVTSSPQGGTTFTATL